jgi:hypothetical protein
MISKFIKLFACVTILNCFFCGTSFSQESTHEADSSTTSIKSPDSTGNGKSKIKQVDFPDVVRELLKIKKKSTDTSKNSTHFAVLPAAGYSLQTGFAVLLAASGTFYIFKNPEPDSHISTFLTSLTYSQYNQIIFPVQTDLWTRSGLYDIITDWRYMDYPSTTFGLGGKTKLNDGYTIDFNYIKLHQSVMRKISNHLSGGVGLYYDVFWNMRQIGVDSGVETSFDKYGFQRKVHAMGIALRLQYDSRDNPINASKGTYLNVVYRPNRTWMGSSNNWNSFLLEYRGYFHLTPTTKNVLAIWSYNWLTVGEGKPPYLLLPSTGWDDFFNTGRGYIQGRFRGKNMVYAESEYRFGISRNGLLGGVVFANAQSFSQFLTTQFQLFTPAFGAGVRIKFNKFTGANLCIDYGVGTDGSKGFAVNLGEVF